MIATLDNLIKFLVDQKSVDEANKQINAISKTAKRLLGAIGIGISLTQLNALAEEFDQIGDRIAYAASEEEQMNGIQQKILDSAVASRTAMSTFTNEVTKLKQANAKVFPLEEASTFVEYVNKLGKAAGYSDSEISSMQTSIQRIVSTGTASAGDITRMMRQTPALAEQVAKSLGVDTDKLQTMAKAGKITAETLKKAINGSTADIDRAFSNLNYGIGDMMVQVRNKWGTWVDETNKQFKITETLAKLGYSMFDKFLSGLTKVRNGVQFLSDKIGGLQNLLKLVAIAASAIFIALNAGKIIGFITKVKSLLTAANLKIAAIALAIGLVLLAIEDVISFMQGKESVLGDILAAAGIDADEFREKIRTVFDTVKNIFLTVFGFIKTLVQTTFQILSQLWDAWGRTILGVLGNVFNTFTDIINTVLSVLGTAVSFIVSLLTGDLGGAFDALGQMFSALVKGIFTVGGDLLKFVADLVIDIAGHFLGLPDEALQWGKDIIDGLVNGIKSVANKVGEAVSGVAGKIRALIGFSVPEEGPLSDFDTYMPDMIDLMASGIRKGKSVIQDAMSALGGSAVDGLAQPKASTVNTVANSTSNRSVYQTNNFNNTFNGEKAFQREASKASARNANDATSQLARAIANG